jgi:hypothetical protein
MTDEQENQQCTERDGFCWGWAASVSLACDEFFRRRGLPVSADYSRWKHWTDEQRIANNEARRVQ